MWTPVALEAGPSRLRPRGRHGGVETMDIAIFGTAIRAPRPAPDRQWRRRSLDSVHWYLKTPVRSAARPVAVSALSSDGVGHGAGSLRPSAIRGPRPRLRNASAWSSSQEQPARKWAEQA